MVAAQGGSIQVWWEGGASDELGDEMNALIGLGGKYLVVIVSSE